MDPKEGGGCGNKSRITTTELPLPSFHQREKKGEKMRELERGKKKSLEWWDEINAMRINLFAKPLKSPTSPDPQPTPLDLELIIKP